MAYIGGKLAPWFDTSPNDRWIKAFVRYGTMQAMDVAKDNTPVHTGDLRENWTFDKTPRRTMTYLGVAWRGEWSNDLDYAAYVEHGTGLYGPEHRKYLIVPKDPGGTLHWVGAGGHDVFAKAVLHPGSPGHHMLAISANVLEARWERWVQPLLNGWAREVEHQNPWAALT